MSAWRRVAIVALTWVVTGFARRTASMHDRALAWVIKIARLFVRKKEIRQAMGDLLEILHEGPPGTIIVRKMLAGIRREEVRDLVQGTFFFEEFDPLDHP